MAKLSNTGLIGQKIGMSRMMSADGTMIPVTLLKIESQKVTKLLTPERDGYHGYQVGYFPKSEKNLTKADCARLRKSSIEENYAKFREFRTSEKPANLELGSELNAELLSEIASVDVTGVTKGRGFQGSVKRWGSRIGRMTHGSRFHRRPGSLGQCTSPGRVFKNKKQPGQMGVANKTIRNVKVVEVDVKNSVVVLKGSVPGHGNGFLELRPTNKR